MTINFPNSPVNGNTYTYLGVVYTYSDTGGGTGLWKVATPGSVGVATSTEINTGTDNTKYLTPSGIEGSEYVKEAYVSSEIAALFNLINPIGTVILRGNDVNPNTTMLGTWVSKGTGHSLLAVGTGSGAGTVGGSSTVGVPVAQHNHGGSFAGTSVGSHTHTGPNHRHSASHNHSGSFSGNAVGSHYHLVASSGTRTTNLSSGNYMGQYNPQNYDNFKPAAAGTGTYANIGRSSSQGGHTPSGSVTVNTKSMNTGYSGTGSTGSGGSHTPAGSITVNYSGIASPTMDVTGATYKVVAWERTA